MKISDSMRFAHPVLSRWTTDYVEGDFSAKISVAEDLGESTVQLSIELGVGDEQLKKLVAEGAASVGVFVTCAETYLSAPKRLQLGPNVVSFATGTLKGRVVLRPLVWTDKKITGWRSAKFNPEYGDSKFDLTEGSLLAIGDEVVINVGWEKLAPVETIFALHKTTEFEPGRLSINLDEEKITILVDPLTHEAVTALRPNPIGASIVMNSVYLPAVMEVLSMLSAGVGSYDTRRWYAPFIAKCEFLGVQIANPELFEDSQRLLQRPAVQLKSVAEGLDL
jgi:hypothetical protein